MTMAALYLTAVLLALVVPGTRAYPTGALVGQCNTMMPNHGGATSQPLNDAPYTVTASKNTYYTGERIMVTVTGNMTFKGLLLKATPMSGSNAVGSFSMVSQEPPLNYLDCSGVANSGVTHSNRNNKTAVMVYWTAPSTSSGNVIFRVTVVQRVDTFYVGLTSSAISYMRKNSTDPMTTTSNPDSGNTGTGIAASVAIVFVALLLNRLA